MLYIAFWCCVSGLNAQTATIVPSTFAAGDASVARQGEWFAFHNPALLASENKVSASAIYENRFSMKELSTQAISLACPTSLVNVGVAVSHFGYSNYSELLAGITFARTFDKWLTIGVQFNYYSVNFSNSVGSKGAVLAQIGLLSQVTPDFFVGFNAFNPTRQKVQYQDIVRDIPSVFSLGVMYRFTDELKWLAQVDKEISSDPIWKTGFEYQPVSVFIVRIGGYGAPFIPTLGAGVKWQNFNFDVNFERHPSLGITSIGVLRYVF